MPFFLNPPPATSRERKAGESGATFGETGVDTPGVDTVAEGVNTPIVC